MTLHQLSRDPREMSDDEITSELKTIYGPDCTVSWWWDWPDEKLGFCVSASIDRVLVYTEIDGKGGDR